MTSLITLNVSTVGMPHLYYLKTSNCTTHSKTIEGKLLEDENQKE